MLFQRLTAVDPSPADAALPEPATLADLGAAGFCFLAFLIPVAQTTWLALTAFALYFAVVGRRDPRILDACWLLLGLSVPLFWGRTLLAVCRGPILNFEAAITAALVGTHPTDNAAPFIDGTGVLWVAPACSTVLCISHALLCAVMFKVGLGLSWSRRLLLATLGACLAVTLVNVVRLWALARFPEWYGTIHGPEGGAAFSFLILGVMVGVLGVAVKYERPHSV